MAQRAAQPASSIAWLIIAAGVAGIGVATYYGYPGLVALWLGLVVAGWSEPRPVFTGPKDSYGAPTPLGAGEHRAKDRYLLLADLRWRLLAPNGDWLPGWPVLGVWFLAVAAAVGAFAIPVAQEEWAWANVAAAYILIVQVAASKRRTGNPIDPNPGVRVDSLGQVEALRPVVAGGAGMFLFATLASAIVLARHPWGLEVPGPPILFGAAVGLASAVGAMWGPWARAGLNEWTERTQARAAWEPRWEVALGKTDKTGAPRLVAHRQVGQLTVDTFDAPSALGAAGLMAAKAKLRTAVGGGYTLAVLATPNIDSDGRPMPGTEHPLRVDVVTFPSDAPPDVTDPAMGEDEAALAISAALSAAVDAYGGGGAQYVFVGIEALHVRPEPKLEPRGWARLFHQAGEQADDGPATAEEADDAAGGQDRPDAGSAGAVWALQYGGANSLQYARSQYAGMMPQFFAQETAVLVNDWPDGDPNHPGAGRIYVGAIFTEGTVYKDPNVPVMLEQLATDDQWRGRWSGVLKTGVNFPDPQFAVAKDAQIGRTSLHHLPFVIRQGEKVDDFEKLEPKLATTLTAAPFVSIVGYPGDGGRPGDRHPQAFVVRWSDGPVPASADRLPPGKDSSDRFGTSSTPEHWVLAGQVNAAFDAARLARPEVISARPLTVPGRGPHLWKVEIRLHGGVSLSEVRAKIARIASTLSVPWLQVTAASQPQCIVMVAGADFRKVRLANPDRDLPYLANLEWQQAWVDAKVVNSSGLTPSTLATTPLATNEKVLQLDFELPSGITPSRVRGVMEKLKGSTRNAFVDVRPGAHGANSIRLLVCEEDPMPFPAPIDFDFIHSPASDGLLPFATGIEGEPVSWNISEDPHLLVVGSSGSGKSSVLQMLLYPMVARGWEIHVADPAKAAADFRFAEPWLTSITTTVPDTSAMMDAVYEEVKRRRALNGQYAVGSYTDLPAEVRPQHVVVVIDEFTSLILADKPRKPATADAEAMAEYEDALEQVRLVENIGSKVGRIVREARSAGVTLVLSTQRLTAKELDSIPGGNTIRTNMSRMILGKATFGELQSALRSPESAPDLGDSVPKGRGLLETSGAPTQIIQSWYDHPIQQVLASRLREAGIGEAPKLDLAPFMPKEADRVVEGALIETPADGVVELDEMEIDLDDLDLSDLDLDHLDDLDEDELDEDESDPGEPAADPEGGTEPEQADVVVTDVPAAAVLGAQVVWTGAPGHAPAGARVEAVPEADESLFSHPKLDVLAAVFTSMPAGTMHWVDADTTTEDETGQLLGQSAADMATQEGWTLTWARNMGGDQEEAPTGHPTVGGDSNEDTFDFDDSPEPPRPATTTGHLLGINEEEFDF